MGNKYILNIHETLHMQTVLIHNWIINALLWFLNLSATALWIELIQVFQVYCDCRYIETTFLFKEK